MVELSENPLAGFGQRIEVLRQKEGLTYSQLSMELAEAGGRATAQAIHKWVKKDGAGISMSNVLALGRIFNKPAGWILFGDQPSHGLTREAIDLAKKIETMDDGQKQYILAQMQFAANYKIDIAPMPPDKFHRNEFTLHEKESEYTQKTKRP